jgi:hypothetical protein
MRPASHRSSDVDAGCGCYNPGLAAAARMHCDDQCRTRPLVLRNDKETGMFYRSIQTCLARGLFVVVRRHWPRPRSCARACPNGRSRRASGQATAPPGHPAQWWRPARHQLRGTGSRIRCGADGPQRTPLESCPACFLRATAHRGR